MGIYSQFCITFSHPASGICFHSGEATGIFVRHIYCQTSQYPRSKNICPCCKVMASDSQNFFLTIPSEAELFQHEMTPHLGFESLRKCCNTTNSIHKISLPKIMQCFITRMQSNLYTSSQLLKLDLLAHSITAAKRWPQGKAFFCRSVGSQHKIFPSAHGSPAVFSHSSQHTTAGWFGLQRLAALRCSKKVDVAGMFVSSSLNISSSNKSAL